MSVRAWAIKPGELKELTRCGLVLLAARCALRVEPCVLEWWPDAPKTVRSLWATSLDHLVRSAFTTTRHDIQRRLRALSNAGSLGRRRCEARDETRATCVNYAFYTLAAAVETGRFTERPLIVKSTIQAAKMSASIAAILAHAGRVPAPVNDDPVDHASRIAWGAIRADAARLTATPDARSCPLWPDPAPAWWPGSRL